MALVNNINVGGIQVSSGVLSSEVLDFLSDDIDLSLHLLGLEGEVLTIEVDGSLLALVHSIDWHIVHCLHIDGLLVIFHADHGVLGDYSGGDSDFLGHLDVYRDLLDLLDLSVDDHVVSHGYLDLVVLELRLLDLGHHLHVNYLLSDDWLLYYHLGGHFDLNEVLSLDPVGLGHSDGDLASLGDWSSSGDLVLDLLVLPTRSLVDWSIDSVDLLALNCLLQRHYSLESAVNSGEFFLDLEPLNRHNVGNNVLLSSMDVGGLVVLDLDVHWSRHGTGSHFLNVMNSVLMVEGGNFVLNNNDLLDRVIDGLGIGVGHLVVSEDGGLILIDGLGCDSNRLELLLEVVNRNVGDCPDHVDLVLRHLDDLLLRGEPNISLKELINLVLALEILKLRDIHLGKLLVGHLADLVDGDIINNGLADRGAHYLIDVLDLLDLINLGDLDNLLDFVLDDLLDRDFFDLLYNDLLLDDSGDWLNYLHVHDLIDVSGFRYLANNDLLDRDLFDLLDNFGLEGSPLTRSEVGGSDLTGLHPGTDDSSFLHFLSYNATHSDDATQFGDVGGGRGRLMSVRGSSSDHGFINNLGGRGIE